jgi:hypothetical protein
VSDPKYVRVELARLRELISLLRDPVQFARDHESQVRAPRARSSDEIFDQYRDTSFSLGWGRSLAEQMLRDAGVKESL